MERSDLSALGRPIRPWHWTKIYAGFVVNKNGTGQKGWDGQEFGLPGNNASVGSNEGSRLLPFCQLCKSTITHSGQRFYSVPALGELRMANALTTSTMEAGDAGG